MLTCSAPLSFFTHTNAGSTINRFSHDLQVVDRELPSSFIGASSAVAQGIANVVLVIAGCKFTGAAMPVLVLTVGVAQIIYLRTSTQLRVMELAARAPLVSHFYDLIRVGESSRDLLPASMLN